MRQRVENEVGRDGMELAHAATRDVSDAIVVLDRLRDGLTNMAIDEALLENAIPDWPIIVRIYGWSEPTVSLGHFQRETELKDQTELVGLPQVRRKTGGGAIVHDQELTYSILVPQRDRILRKGHNELLYRAVHEAVLCGLRDMGWDAKLAESCTCATVKNEKKDPFLCFLRRTPVDLLVGMHKILGSAQRRTAAGLLQHGSLLIRHSLSTPRLLGLLDLPQSPISVSSSVSHLDANYSSFFSQFGSCHSSLVDTSISKVSNMSSPLPFAVETWSRLLSGCVRQGLEKVFGCNWLEVLPEVVRDSVDPWRQSPREGD